MYHILNNNDAFQIESLFMHVIWIKSYHFFENTKYDLRSNNYIYYLSSKCIWNDCL